MENNLIQDSYSSIISLVFDDAQRSLKDIDNSINTLNIKLSAVIGFSATFIKFAGDLPDQTYTYVCLSCFTCLFLKVFSILLLGLSIFIALKALLPRQNEAKIISPKEQIEKCLELSEDEYKLLFINLLDRDIQSLIQFRDWKSKRLNWAGEALASASVVSGIDLILDSILKSI